MGWFIDKVKELTKRCIDFIRNRVFPAFSTLVRIVGSFFARFLGWTQRVFNYIERITNRIVVGAATFLKKNSNGTFQEVAFTYTKNDNGTYRRDETITSEAIPLSAVPAEYRKRAAELESNNHLNISKGTNRAVEVVEVLENSY